MECADHSGGMNIGDVVLHPAESLDVLSQGLPFLLGNDMQITRLAMSLVASGKGAHILITKIRQEEIESTGKCINHDMALGLRANGK